MNVGSFALGPSLVHATVLEGCVNETLAAIEAEIAGALAEPPAVRDALLAIERQHSDHASLAFRCVDWVIAVGGREVRAAARSAFALASAGNRADQLAGAPVDALEPGLRSHGRLTERARGELRKRALHEVIAPAARSLLGRRAQP